jgi:hypothetical protein
MCADGKKKKLGAPWGSRAPRSDVDAQQAIAAVPLGFLTTLLAIAVWGAIDIVDSIDLREKKDDESFACVVCLSPVSAIEGKNEYDAGLCYFDKGNVYVHLFWRKKRPSKN